MGKSSEQFFEGGTIFKKEGSDFVAFGFAEKNGTEGIRFYILSSKEKFFRTMTLEMAKEVHCLFKEAGSYKQDQNTMGVFKIYVTNENVPFIERNL